MVFQEMLPYESPENETPDQMRALVPPLSEVGFDNGRKNFRNPAFSVRSITFHIFVDPSNPFSISDVISLALIPRAGFQGIFVLLTDLFRSLFCRFYFKPFMFHLAGNSFKFFSELQIYVLVHL
eukprot:CAMPEP_0115009912 /NCGR_PEP_ID=MMETSP0216-20121206/22952_1 /TAXON_ID=223996 /ORGANISM="Protocruzia adherens, Strain Boccale" /LENGTH=123 /DNA_ID=CAMNT_0002377925 /DNA_START=149 /DNA_END=520 /DNA_ORIENTATION=-